LEVDDGVGDTDLGESDFLPLPLTLALVSVSDARLTNDVVFLGEDGNEPAVARVSCSGLGGVVVPLEPFISIAGVTAPDR